MQRICITFILLAHWLGSFSQEVSISEIIKDIEKNNTELKAFSMQIKKQEFNLQGTNVLPNPDASAYFLPFGNSALGDYFEFEVAQTFEFPTIYRVRKEMIGQEIDLMEIEYLKKREEVLLEAKFLIQELIYLNKILEIETLRLSNAKITFDQIQTQFDKGQIGILDFNKSKIVFMNSQFAIEKINLEKEEKLKQLSKLNGGVPIEIQITDFESEIALMNKDSAWADFKNNSKLIAYYNQREKLAQQNITLAKIKQLPDISIGYNYQGFSQDYSSGIFAGLSIPIWGNKNRKISAQYNFELSKVNSSTVLTNVEKDFSATHDKYNSLYQLHSHYKSTLGSIESEELLLKAYENGQISFSEFSIELDFYYRAIDELLKMEKQLQLLRSELFKYQL